MNSRERILAAINHKQPDRIPVDLGGTHDSTLNITVHHAISEYFGQSWNNYNLYDWANGMVFPDERILENFHIDTRSIYQGKSDILELPEFYRAIGIQELSDGSLAYFDDNGNMTHRKPLDGVSFQETFFPLKGNELTAQFSEKFYNKIDTSDLREEARLISEKACILKSDTEYAVIQSKVMGMVVTPVQLAMGYEDWFINLACNPKELLYLTEKYLENQVLPVLEEYFRFVGKYIDVAYCIGDDLADQRGPMFDPSVYRKYFKPMHKRIVETVKKYTQAKIVFHMCGSANEFISDLIDIGIDAINPVQTHANHMEPFMLKNEYGKDITFWGGFDTQKILSFGSEHDVREEVKFISDTLGQNGGFVFAPCHNIQQGTPVKNIIAMFDEINKY